VIIIGISRQRSYSNNNNLDIKKFKSTLPYHIVKKDGVTSGGAQSNLQILYQFIFLNAKIYYNDNFESCVD